MAMHHGSLNCKGLAAIADPNVLDGYEEGTWTPVVLGTTTSGTCAYSGQVGTYTRIGRVVFFTFNVTWTGHTGTGGIQLGGLPFSASGTAPGVSLYVSDLSFTAGAELQAYVAGNSLFFKQAAAGAGAVDIPMDAAAQIAGSGFFFI